MSQPSYSLGTKQQMSVSPRLQQAVRLLQMSALEFEQELRQQLADNPFLEENEDGEPLASDAVAAEVSVAGAENEHLHAAMDLPTELAQFDRLDVLASSDGPAEGSMDDGLPVGSPELEVSFLEAADWQELPEPGFETPAGNGGGESDIDPWHWLAAAPSLRSHLHQQLSGARLAPRAAHAAMLVIETLEDDGYLREEIDSSALPADFGAPLTAAEIGAAIQIVQQLDPAGVAARTLSECLLLQLRALDIATPGRSLALKIAGNHLELLGRHDYGSLTRRLDCSAPALKVAHGLIRRLDPRPGDRFESRRTDYIVPDIIVTEHKGQLTAVVNPAVLPRARLNRSCIDLLKRSTDARHPAMQHQLQEARWLLRNAAQRHITIQRVAEAIIGRQRAFFHHGEIALKPLVLREVADQLGLHESTLSRATANKYMATSRGIYEFRHFFSRQLSTDTGGSCSATAVRQLIKDMIETESREAPLSDVRLAKLLTNSGICVARRTVAKYRNQLKMPPWELRHLP